jgi:uracil-DNA glycosylase family 4
MLETKNQQCQLCPLHESANTPGINMRHADECPPRAASRAVLFIGEAPGATEDRHGKNWIGPAGTLLNNFINLSRLYDHADIYLTNAVRCRPPQASPPTNGQINICQQYLIAELNHLTTLYSEVIIFACGASACKVVSRCKLPLSAAFHQQGSSGEDLAGISLTAYLKYHKATIKSPPFCYHPEKIKLFATYHPAILLPGRKPALVKAVEDHFILLLRYLKGQFQPNSLKITPEVGIKPPEVDAFPSHLTIDIETYGILAGKEQTVFHPTKSALVDGIPYGQQVITVSIGWHPKEDSPTVMSHVTPKTVTSGGFSTVRTALYVFSNHIHRKYIQQWLSRANAVGCTIVGQNIPFDLQYLAANDPALTSIIDPSRMTIDDTMILSFLLYEQRPERGLKELSTLFGIADYSSSKVTSKTGRASSAQDPDLHHYNCLDSAATLILYKELQSRILERFGNFTTKFSKACLAMRNQVLWCTIDMARRGFGMDTAKLREAHALYETIRTECVDFCAQSNLKISGAGSKGSLDEFFTAAVNDYELAADHRLERTDKRRDISIGINNINLILGEMARHNDLDPRALTLGYFSNYKKYDKYISSYTRKLLTDPRKGIVRTGKSGVGRCWPTWYPTPRPSSKDSSDLDGGTIQARFSCKDPAVQTFPPEIMRCLTSVFHRGHIAGYDESQIELRTAGLLSGDPVMLDVFANNEDYHTKTALDTIPGARRDHPDWYGQRQLGKKLNFLVLYKGGPGTFQHTCRTELGLELSMSMCEQIIYNFDTHHLQLRTWQNQLIETARQKGYIELVTGWTRTFGTGANADTYIAEICNFPIQTIAAQLTQSAQFAVTRDLIDRKLRSFIALQIHDAIYVDVAPGEGKIVDEICDKYLTRPPLLDIISGVLNRTVPLRYEKSVKGAA